MRGVTAYSANSGMLRSPHVASLRCQHQVSRANPLSRLVAALWADDDGAGWKSSTPTLPQSPLPPTESCALMSSRLGCCTWSFRPAAIQVSFRTFRL